MKRGKGRNNGLLPHSLRIISSCLKTVSTNATTVASTVRTAGASVAASISASVEDHKDHVTWAGFDKLELGPSAFKRVLLLGYQNGFQVLDVEDASNFSELVSKRDGPVSFLQILPLPVKLEGLEGNIRSSHPLLLVVAGDDAHNLNQGQAPSHFSGPGGRDGTHSPSSVRFYSLRTHCYVRALRFRSAVLMVRCSPRIIAVGLATQIFCIDALTLENKFSVLTYPVPQLAGEGGSTGVNVGYGPMAVGPRWLAYASNSPLLSSICRLSPQNHTTSPGVSVSTSPNGSSSLVARYAMESSKHLAAGIVNLGDMGYKSLSKYCQELLPDGSSSPVSSNSDWKIGRRGGSDMDNAGMVVVKDLVSRAIITQFKAHSSPISALCFDPSGTLLVTASVCGNNINIFRIMPSSTQNGSGAPISDRSSSHVHLYKLHRGITSAIIQDICFSHYSQWIAVVSSKGTCHIFVLSPFGGDSGFESLGFTTDEGPSLHPLLSLPWWSTSSCTISKHGSPPPPPICLSVVSRIKYSSFGWLSNTVGSVTGSSASGKVFVPSGAVAAVFHNSVPQKSICDDTPRTSSLEYLLVYAPSGHVVQHKLFPSIGPETSGTGSGPQPSLISHIQDDDLKVKVQPVQWWDVCRRSDWPEREQCICGQDAADTNQRKSDCGNNSSVDFLDINGDASQKNKRAYLLQSDEKSHWYLANAELHIASWRFPAWEKSKIYFYVMDPQRVDSNTNDESEIEKVPAHEIEVKRKELLPVFDIKNSIKQGWNENDRSLAGAKYILPSVSDHHESDDGKNLQETVICDSKPSSGCSTESSECGSSRRIEHLLDLDHINSEKSQIPTSQYLIDTHEENIEHHPFEFCKSVKHPGALSVDFLFPNHPLNADSPVQGNTASDMLSLDGDLPAVGKVTSEDASLISTKRDGAANFTATGMIVGFELSLNEGLITNEGLHGSADVSGNNLECSSNRR
ncbi:unnamed protein product [Linum tenue]|uniref:Autophagy-related protein 18g n=1 Tax=Linum tenue TaxID=586396 RepID=A0AAV0IE53_9ROSI|nr:unnamed protein product [Linum tenue]